MEFEEGDVVLCTVDRIVGTTVFVHIEGNGEGSIILSEIAPGRIRNIRAYVVPKKTIVCKVLRISRNRIELSLRRVTQKERKEVLDKFKQEKSYNNMLKSILGERAEKVIKEISKEESLYDFFQKAKENSKNLEKIVGKKDVKKILEILESQKPKKTIIKKEISLKSKNPKGLNEIKEILGKIKNIEIKYLSGGKYSLKIGGNDPKKIDSELQEILKNIEKKAKKYHLDFSIIKK